MENKKLNKAFEQIKNIKMQNDEKSLMFAKLSLKIEDQNLNKGINEIKSIKMTDIEKSSMFKNITKTSIQNNNIYSNLNVLYSFFVQKRSMAYSFLFILFFSTASLVFASRSSLPGDILYPMKVGFLEPVEGRALVKPEEKVNYQANLAIRRLLEAENLAENGKLDQDKENKIDSLLELHSNKFNSEFNSLIRGSDKEDNIGLITSFNAEMNAHAAIIDIIKGRDESKVSSKISEAARQRADNVKNNFDGYIENKYKDENKKINKEKIQKIVNKIRTDVNTIDSGTSFKKQEIIINTHKNLEKADKLLKEFDYEEKKGNNKGSYKKLIDSESSAKEAGILLNIGLGL